MQTQPLTSIIIPAYNAEQFIGRTLESALGQTYSNLEVIVVDDGSKDGTVKAAEAVIKGDPRVRILRVPNGGVASARNIGIREAKGTFVAFLDADDLWHPEKIARQVAALSDPKSSGGAAAVYTLFRGIDTEDHVTGMGRLTAMEGYVFARHLYLRPVGNGSSILTFREIALAVGGYDSSWAARGLGGCEDLDFELKIAAKYPIAAINLHLVGYRSYPGNMSSNTRAIALGAIGTVDQHIRACPELPNWAARLARASVLEFTLERLLAGRHWRDIVSSFASLMRASPRRGLKLAVKVPTHKVRRHLSELRHRKDVNGPLPHFYDLSPEFYPVITPSPAQKRDEKIIRSLEPVDLALQKTKAQKLDPSLLST